MAGLCEGGNEPPGSFKSPKYLTEEKEDTKGMAYILNYGTISGKIDRILRKHEIKSIHKPRPHGTEALKKTTELLESLEATIQFTLMKT
ncbi:hypothetical protein ANN_07550 [Periplaneta americana]|uniref:Uncharacterized protein n=1 Tax=Periplaneta americana TaxID=6978 RepID=A0ABQ8T0B5_PERAM|nr:hypothetical protein ANN_07550 [Periplaneta americana]